jgi:hypothetical protein
MRKAFNEGFPKIVLPPSSPDHSKTRPQPRPQKLSPRHSPDGNHAVRHRVLALRTLTNKWYSQGSEVKDGKERCPLPANSGCPQHDLNTKHQNYQLKWAARMICLTIERSDRRLCPFAPTNDSAFHVWTGRKNGVSSYLLRRTIGYVALRFTSNQLSVPSYPIDILLAHS